jgi:predicted YcjX-like family ATPase
LILAAESPLSVESSPIALSARVSPPAWLPVFRIFVEEARLSARALWDYGDSLFNPTVRLGVTGLSRAGKTVFITALIHGLTRGGRFPCSSPMPRADRPRPPGAAAGRRGAALRLREPCPHPDRGAALAELDHRHQRTRLVIDYQRQNGADRSLTLDIVDYPGEWLLDLPLLNKSYEQWSAESLALSREGRARKLAAPGTSISRR